MPARTATPFPLIDLHVHLEGSISRSTLAILAARHGLPVPRTDAFAGFHGFLKAFGAVCDLLVDERDFERAADDLFARSRRIGVAHMEVLFSPQVFLRRGIALATIMGGLLTARCRAMTATGLSVVYIMDGVRQWGGGWFRDVVRASAPWAGSGLAGIGVGGDEASVPAREFSDAFRAARELGLRTTIHAGEAAGPEAVRQALEQLRVHRIGHGVRSAEDPSLVRRLASSGICLELCPSSNVATGVVDSWPTHPLRRLFDAGVTVTVNSDDGAFFATDVARELEKARRIQRFTKSELMSLQLNAARNAFLGRRETKMLAQRVTRAWSLANPEGARTRGERPPLASG